MDDEPRTFSLEWEDETGLIRTIEIRLPDLHIESDESEVREILLNRKLRLDKDEIPDWIENIPERKPN